MGLAILMRIGRCEVCGKRKTNLTDHHLAEWDLSGVMMVCQECHVFINQFREALAKARKLQGRPEPSTNM